MKKYSVCLSMIVKNEEKCIASCLNHLKKYVDYWVICDTGSADRTKEIISETMEGIPGEIQSHDWIDFATNRNLALQASKDKADFSLIMDADDSLIVEDESIFDNLDQDAYRIKIRHGGIEYYRPQLIKNSLDFKYKGVLHEYIELPPCQYVQLDGCYIQTSFSGNRSRNPNKFLDDCKVLEKAIVDEPDNARYVFYLAQSYRDANLDLKAIEYYEKRAKMGGWLEEVFVSLIEIGKAKERLGFPIFEVEKAYLEATYAAPHRAEASYQLARLFRSKDSFNKSYCYAKESLKIIKPKEGLFLDEACYAYKRLDELSVSAYYLQHYKEGIAACEEILKLNIPPGERDRIEKNYQFFREKMQIA
jgi:glycosyltransferase involved in cell wall biosynthesis